MQTGTFSFATTLSYAAAFGFGTFTPYVTSSGIWTFANTNSGQSIASISATPGRGIRLRVEGRVNIAAKGAANLSGSGFYDGIGSSGHSAWGGKLFLSHRFWGAAGDAYR